MDNSTWYTLKNSSEVISPSLLVYPDRVEENIKKMVAMVGDVSRLRPHIKTHKTAEIINLQMAYGIHKFKCATIAEAELLARCEAKDILLAIQPVGYNIDRFLKLQKNFPEAQFATIVDSQLILEEINHKAQLDGSRVKLFMDVNSGMNRTGIAPGEEAIALFSKMTNSSQIEAMGLHVYDGHIRNPDIADRKKVCDSAFEKVIQLKKSIEAQGNVVGHIVAGGSPTFPIHAKREQIEASPGTTLLWDARYGSLFKDMDFKIAAVLFTRIISKPTTNTLCLDLGHKAIAPEMEFPRVQLLSMENCEQIGQSEEHLVLKCDNAALYEVGDACYAIPMHICPTVAKYAELLTVKEGQITGSWQVVARNHKLTI